jgi:hypothetical protein
MSESQLHGFLWERAIREDVFRVNPRNGYTSIHDIDKTENRFNESENISIKTMGKDTLFLGSASRILRYSSEEVHTAIVIVYEQRGEAKRVTRVVEFSLDDKRALFGDVTPDEVETLERMLKELPKSGRVPAELRTESEAFKKYINAKSGAVQFNIKIDSKTQRRLQCSIPHFDAFLTKRSDLVGYDSPEPSVREVAIPAEFVSSRRRRVQKESSLPL